MWGAKCATSSGQELTTVGENMGRKPAKLRAVVRRDGDWYSAQCLEYDIAVQAKTMRGLAEEINRALDAHIILAKQAGREPFDDLEQAPKKFWVLYDQATALVELKDVKPSPRLASPKRMGRRSFASFGFRLSEAHAM